MNSFWQEVRFSFRMFVKNPVFTLVIVVTLALGIGANTAIFSLVDAVLLKKLPVREPEQLVLFKALAHPTFDFGSYNGSTHLDPTTGLTAATSFPYQTYVRLREQKGVMSQVFAFAGFGVNVNVDGEADVTRAQVISGNYHAALGVQPAIGRTITDSDDQSSATPVAVISDRYWQRRFMRDPAVVGKQIKINNVSFTVIGVTPPQFTGTGQVGSSPDISVPLALEPQLNSERSRMKGAGQWWLRLMGRLQPGVTRAQARASLESAFQESVMAHRSASVRPGQAPLPTVEPKDMPRLGVDSGSQGEMDSRRRLAPQLYILLGVVALVLLIACANVANLLLVNATSRQREIAVRLALGSSRWRVIRMLLTESVMLSLLGGALGLILASWIKDALLVWAFGGRALTALTPRLDFRVFGFTIGLALLTAILFGLVPAWRSSRIDLTPSLKETPKTLGGVSRSLLSKSLVVVQVAMSLLLLIGAGLFLRTLHNLQTVPTGFNSENLLLFNVEPSLVGYKNAALADLYKQMFVRLENVPGVRSVTFSRNGLLTGAISGRDVYLPLTANSSDSSPRHLGEIRLHQVRENFFATMEIPLISGRSLSSYDDERAPKVAVINQSLAALVSPNESPLGKRFGFAPDNASEVEVVGVVGDSKYGNLRDDSPPTFYVPWLQELRGVGGGAFAVRTTGEPTAQAGAIRNAVREVDPDLPVIGVTTQAELADQSVTTERLFARLLSLFGVLAMLLAAVGLYGVMAYSVTQRTREIGIRMALGAQRNNVLKLVLSQGIILILIGIALGAGGAFWLTRLMKSMLFGVSATDPATFIGIALLLSLVALLATYIPARRATKVNPLVALRYE